jgi:hypothetical protein
LTVGSAVGSIREIFAKIKAIDAKHGKFDFVLCAGDFFGPPKEGGESGLEDDISQLLGGNIEGSFLKIHVVKLTYGGPLVPLKCYIMQGEHPLPERVIEKFAKTGGELCRDVFLLGEHYSPFGHLRCTHASAGKSGIITTTNGLRVACIGGIYDPDIYSAAETAPVRQLPKVIVYILIAVTF